MRWIGAGGIVEEFARLRGDELGELSGQLLDCIPAQMVAAGSEAQQRRLAVDCSTIQSAKANDYPVNQTILERGFSLSAWFSLSRGFVALSSVGVRGEQRVGGEGYAA